jgi:hypothetical protein
MGSIWGEYLLVLSEEPVKVTPTYEETIHGGTIGHRFKRGVDWLQPLFGQQRASAGSDERCPGYSGRAEHERRSVKHFHLFGTTPDKFCPALFLPANSPFWRLTDCAL